MMITVKMLSFIVHGRVRQAGGRLPTASQG
jgi:hypothetical protein